MANKDTRSQQAIFFFFLHIQYEHSGNGLTVRLYNVDLNCEFGFFIINDWLVKYEPYL